MSSHLLFVVGQPGGASFLMPLWQRWIIRGTAFPWFVMAHPACKSYLDDSSIPLAQRFSWPDSQDQLLNQIGHIANLHGVVTSTCTWEVMGEKAKPFCQWQEEQSLSVIKKSKGKCAVLIDAPYDYGRRYRAVTATAKDADAILISDKISKSEAIAEGLPEDKTITVGHPAWENIKKIPRGLAGHVLFASQPVEADFGRQLGYTEIEVFHIIEEARRLYPNLFKRLIWGPHPRENHNDVIAEGCDETVASGKDAVESVDTVIGMFPALLIEAGLLGRKVISIQPNLIGKDRCLLTKGGYLKRVNDADELIAQLNAPNCGNFENLRKELIGSCDRLEEAILVNTGLRSLTEMQENLIG